VLFIINGVPVFVVDIKTNPEILEEADNEFVLIIEALLIYVEEILVEIIEEPVKRFVIGPVKKGLMIVGPLVITNIVPRPLCVFIVEVVPVIVIGPVIVPLNVLAEVAESANWALAEYNKETNELLDTMNGAPVFAVDVNCTELTDPNTVIDPLLNILAEPNDPLRLNEEPITPKGPNALVVVERSASDALATYNEGTKAVLATIRGALVAVVEICCPAILVKLEIVPVAFIDVAFMDTVLRDTVLKDVADILVLIIEEAVKRFVIGPVKKGLMIVGPFWITNIVPRPLCVFIVEVVPIIVIGPIIVPLNVLAEVAESANWDLATYNKGTNELLDTINGAPVFVVEICCKALIDPLRPNEKPIAPLDNVKVVVDTVEVSDNADLAV